MALHQLLPSNLRRILETSTDPFESIATKFLNSIPNPDDNFTYACEILNTLTILKDGRNTTGKKLFDGSFERIASFILNGTFVLYWMYREYDLKLNPFMSYFVEVYDSDSKSLRYNRRAADSVGSYSTSAISKARVKLILTILGSDGGKLETITPKYFLDNLDSHGLGKSIDISSFRVNDLEDQFASMSMNGTTSSPDVNNTMSNNSKGKQKATEAPLLPQDNLATESTRNLPVDSTNPNLSSDGTDSLKVLLRDACDRSLQTDERELLKSQVKIAVNYCGLIIDDFKMILENNHEIARSLVIELLASEKNGELSDIRTQMLDSVLPRTELELKSIELINYIVVRPTLDETPGTPVSTGNELEKPPIISTTERTHLLHLFIANWIRQVENRDEDGRRPAARRGNPEVARKIKLICMFITHMLNNDITTAQELYYEAQDIYMGFLWVKEARELWLNITGGNGIGVPVIRD